MPVLDGLSIFVDPSDTEGYIASLWQREVRRDFIDNAPIVTFLSVNEIGNILICICV